MAQVLIRGLDPTTVEKLKARARRNRRSLQAELRAVIEAAATSVDYGAGLERIRRMLAGRTFSERARSTREDSER